MLTAADYTLVTHRDVFAGQAASGKAEWLPGRWLAGSRPGAGACWTTTLRREKSLVTKYPLPPRKQAYTSSGRHFFQLAASERRAGLVRRLHPNKPTLALR
jgi:hypothetical protein